MMYVQRVRRERNEGKKDDSPATTPRKHHNERETIRDDETTGSLGGRVRGSGMGNRGWLENRQSSRPRAEPQAPRREQTKNPPELCTRDDVCLRTRKTTKEKRNKCLGG